MIDIDITVEAKFFRRWLTVKQMKEILNQLDNDDALFPNCVGNLSVTRNSEQQMRGYIDFQKERFEAV